MPNNVTPVVTLEALRNKAAIAQRKARCDIGFHLTRRIAEAQRDVAVIGHGHVLAVLAAHLRGQPAIHGRNYKLSPAAIVVIPKP